MRSWWLSAVLLACAASAWAQDVRSIVERAIEVDRQEQEAVLKYTYVQRQETRSLDGAGKVKSVHSRTTGIVRLEGSPYRRLIAIDDKPLPPADQRKEDEKERFNVEQRRKETPEDRDRRLADWRHRQEQRRAPLRELPEAFDFHLSGEENMGGRTALVIDAMPHPGYKPKSTLTSFLPKVKARFWIEKAGLHCMKIEMEALDTISFGGILLRLGKGSRLVIDQAYINHEVWVPSDAVVTASARVLLLVGVRQEIEFTFKDYKKLSADPGSSESVQ